MTLFMMDVTAGVGGESGSEGEEDNRIYTLAVNHRSLGSTSLVFVLDASNCQPT